MQQKERKGGQINVAKVFVEVEGSIGQKLAYLLSDTAAPGLIRIITRKNYV